MPRKHNAPGPADRERLLHMRVAAEQGIEFIRGRVRADLETDAMLRRALVSAIQEIGEAASRLSHGARDRVRGVPWPAVVRMRNVIVHIYWGVDLDRVWKTASEDLPLLLCALEDALDEWPEEA